MHTACQRIGFRTATVRESVVNGYEESLQDDAANPTNEHAYPAGIPKIEEFTAPTAGTSVACPGRWEKNPCQESSAFVKYYRAL